MDYKIAICDDSKSDREKIAGMVRRWAEGSGGGVRIDEFPSAESFLFAYAEKRDYDILLLDVEMRDISGIELAKRVRAQRGRAEIVFITSHFEFIAEGYEVDALHYLVKPVSREKLFEVLDRAAARLAVEPPSVVVSFDGGTVKLLEADILYVEAFAHYIEIHTRTDVYRVKESITAFGGAAVRRLFPGPPVVHRQSPGRGADLPHVRPAVRRGGGPPGPGEVRRCEPGVHREELTC